MGLERSPVIQPPSLIISPPSFAPRLATPTGDPALEKRVETYRHNLRLGLHAAVARPCRVGPETRNAQEVAKSIIALKWYEFIASSFANAADHGEIERLAEKLDAGVLYILRCRGEASVAAYECYQEVIVRARRHSPPPFVSTFINRYVSPVHEGIIAAIAHVITNGYEPVGKGVVETILDPELRVDVNNVMDAATRGASVLAGSEGMDWQIVERNGRAAPRGGGARPPHARPEESPWDARSWRAWPHRLRAPAASLFRVG